MKVSVAIHGAPLTSQDSGITRRAVGLALNLVDCGDDDYFGTHLERHASNGHLLQQGGLKSLANHMSTDSHLQKTSTHLQHLARRRLDTEAAWAT